MNVLEHYIKEVISVEPYEAEWTKKFDSEFVKIVAIVDCYGAVNQCESIEKVLEWEKIKERGYFMK